MFLSRYAAQGYDDIAQIALCIPIIVQAKLKDDEK
jgi:hypothetical protein